MIWTWPFWALYFLCKLFLPLRLFNDCRASKKWCKVGVHNDVWYFTGVCLKCGGQT